MKFILSRKGFDSQFGGHPSPVLADGTMLSLPIPAWNQQHLPCETGIHYCDLNLQGFRVNGCSCHLDPDIRPELYRHLPDGWTATFGQDGAAASHLLKEHAASGDVFLFFGLFQHWNTEKGFWGNPFHAVWGYMQIDRIIDLEKDHEAPKKYSWHPHAKKDFSAQISPKSRNLLFTAAQHLSFSAQRHGYGVFSYKDALRLTLPNQKYLTHWQYPHIPWVEPQKKAHMTYHTDKNCQADYFLSASRGQEFVIDESRSEIMCRYMETLFPGTTIHRCPRLNTRTMEECKQ